VDSSGTLSVPETLSPPWGPEGVHPAAQRAVNSNSIANSKEMVLFIFFCLVIVILAPILPQRLPFCNKKTQSFGFCLLGHCAAFFFEAPFDAKPSPFFPPS
jgi:hypothetical protein